MRDFDRGIRLTERGRDKTRHTLFWWKGMRVAVSKDGARREHLCFSGISGDMTLGALLHAGLDEAAWRAEFAMLNVPGYEIRVEPMVKEEM